jgi:hypothetical protein
MGDVDVKQVKNIDPVTIKEIDRVSNIEPLRIAKIAPAAVHVKELNHIDPITVDSLRVDEVRNLEPVKIERFDVTHLPTVNLTLGEVPALDLNLRRIPPLAVGLHQEFVLPSEYFIRARLLGLEFLRVHVTGRTRVHPHDRTRREVSSSHERSFQEVAAVGNPAIPVTCREEYAEAVIREPPRRSARQNVGARALLRRRAVRPMSRAGLSVGGPPVAFPLAPAQENGVESAVSSG